MGEKPTIEIDMSGEDGNSFAIIHKVQGVMKQNGATHKECADFLEKCISGDRENLLKLVREHVNLVEI